MCQIFRTQDPSRYRAETRAIRLHGQMTSVRLERAFWGILKEIADSEGMTLSQFASTLYDEVMEQTGEMANFASFLRVTCLTYLSNNRGVQPEASRKVQQAA
jgi:predicted DNA-binding ribbon-helix-helix protein